MRIIQTRAVESESLKAGKNLKIGKIGFVFLLDFLSKMPKCHKMSKCLHYGSGSWIRIFFLTLISLESEVLHRWDASWNDHKSKGCLPVKKSDKNDLKLLGHPTFIRLFKIRFHSSNTDTRIRKRKGLHIVRNRYIVLMEWSVVINKLTMGFTNVWTIPLWTIHTWTIAVWNTTTFALSQLDY